MTSQEFATLVAVHRLPIPWLASRVGRVSARTMQYWIAGRPGQQVTVPADVVLKMQRLNLLINQALNLKKIGKQMGAAHVDVPEVVFKIAILQEKIKTFKP